MQRLRKTGGLRGAVGPFQVHDHLSDQRTIGGGGFSSAVDGLTLRSLTPTTMRVRRQVELLPHKRSLYDSPADSTWESTGLPADSKTARCYHPETGKKSWRGSRNPQVSVRRASARRARAAGDAPDTGQPRLLHQLRPLARARAGAQRLDGAHLSCTVRARPSDASATVGEIETGVKWKVKAPLNIERGDPITEWTTQVKAARTVLAAEAGAWSR